MSYKSINPATKKELKTYEYISDHELLGKMECGYDAYLDWAATSLSQRLAYIEELSSLLLTQKELHARLISVEMGKPIAQSIAEIEKCVSLGRYYVENAERLLAPEFFKSGARSSYTIYNPMGLVYGVMPWNFPYWQVFRYVVPNLILGNGILLKHASNVPQCAEAMERICSEAKLPEGLFQNLFIDYKQSDKVIESDYVCGVTLTGSEHAGAMVASGAGRNIKKSVLELGGSDPFIVLEDARIDEAVKIGVLARMQNTGQSCIAAKRFILHESIYDEFLDKYVNEVEKMTIGDPLEFATEIGPIASGGLVDELEDQVNKSIEAGAKVLTGGTRLEQGSNFYKPTVLAGISKACPVYAEEVFGPVASMYRVDSDDEAIRLANDTEFGLGASLWTDNIEKAKRMVPHINSGTIAINGMVKSDPGLPFGGTKKSGYGRELSEIGLKEFSNMKTINIF